MLVVMLSSSNSNSTGNGNKLESYDMWRSLIDLGNLEKGKVWRRGKKGRREAEELLIV